MLGPVDAFKALSDTERFRLFIVILRHPGEDRRFYTKYVVDVGNTSTWHHLQVLKKCGLITQDTIDAKDVRYKPNKENIIKLADFLKGLVTDDEQA